MVILSHNLPFILIEFNFKVLFRLLKFNAKNKSGNTFYYLIVYVPFKGFDGRRAGSIKISVLNVICCTQKGVFLNTCGTNLYATDTVFLQILFNTNE